LCDEPQTPKAQGFLGTVNRPRVSRVLSRGRYSRRRWQAGAIVLHQSASLRAKRGRGREGEPLNWTGEVWSFKAGAQANPRSLWLRRSPSTRKRAEVFE